MFKLLAYRRLLAVGAFAVCALLFSSMIDSAEARSRHRGYHSHSHSYHHAGRHHVRKKHAYRRHVSRSKSRYARRAARIERMQRARNAYAALTPQSNAAALMQHRDYAALAPQDGVSTQAQQPPALAAQAGFGSSLVAEARRYIGSGNPTSRRSLWCARFMNMVLERSGKKTTGSDMARSFANYGTRVSGPQVGAIAVMTRGRRGGHVGVVSGVDANGNPIVVSGNHSRRVAEATYSRSRVYAYVMPN